MATMGVKMVGDGGAGFGKLGQTLADALFGNAETEMKMARLRQDYDTEAWRRKVMDAQAAAQQSVADKNAWELETRQQNLPTVQDYRAGLVEKPTMPEPPAPVEIPAPEPLPVTPELAAVETQAAAHPLPGTSFSADPSQDPALAHMFPPDWAAPAEVTQLLSPYTPHPIAPLQDPGITSLATQPERFDRLGLGARTEPVTPQQQATYQQEVGDRQAAYEREVASRRAEAALTVAGGGTANQMAQGLGIGEGAIKLESKDPAVAAQGALLYTGQAAAAGGDLETVQKLRKEFEGTPEFTKWSIVHSGYQNMRGAMDTLAQIDNKDDPRRGPADIRLIYNYMKLMDPGTGVKEGEYTTAREAGGKFAAAWNLYDRIVSGAVMDQETRVAFLDQAADMYKIASQDLAPHVQKLSHEAELYKIDPSRIVSQPEDIPEYKSALPPGITEEEIARVLAANPSYSRTDAVHRIIDMRRPGTGRQ